MVYANDFRLRSGKFSKPIMVAETSSATTGGDKQQWFRMAFVNYIPEMDLILMDHLISENNDSANKWTYVPDGDQEGFRWEKGKWVHINKVFTQKLRDGQAPREIPLFEKKN